MKKLKVLLGASILFWGYTCFSALAIRDVFPPAEAPSCQSKLQQCQESLSICQQNLSQYNAVENETTGY